MTGKKLLQILILMYKLSHLKSVTSFRALSELIEQGLETILVVGYVC